MTIYEFAKLTKDEKATTTWNGTFLASREKDELKYALYSVYDFFVEVSYKVTDNKILDFSSSQTKKAFGRISKRNHNRYYILLTSKLNLSSLAVSQYR